MSFRERKPTFLEKIAEKFAHLKKKLYLCTLFLLRARVYALRTREKA